MVAVMNWYMAASERRRVQARDIVREQLRDIVREQLKVH